MSQRSKIMRKIRAEAATHPDGCDCTTCRAASGDNEAFRQIYKNVV